MLAMLLLLFWTQQAGSGSAAGSASFSMAGGTYQPGSSFSVTVYENSGADGVNIAQADIHYDSKVLQLVGVDTSGSAFPGDLTPYTGSGDADTITIARFTPSPVNQKVVLGVINFKAVNQAATTSLFFEPTSAIASNGAPVWDQNPSTANYTIAAAKTPVAETPAAGGSSVTVAKDPTEKVSKEPLVEVKEVFDPADDSYVAHRVIKPLDSGFNLPLFIICFGVMVIIALSAILLLQIGKRTLEDTIPDQPE